MQNRPSRCAGCRRLMRVSLIAAATGPWTDGKPDMRRFRTSMRVRKGKFNNERHAENTLQAQLLRRAAVSRRHGTAAGGRRQAAGGRGGRLFWPLPPPTTERGAGWNQISVCLGALFDDSPPIRIRKLKNSTQTKKQNRRERAISNVSLSIHLVRHHPDPQPPLPATNQLYLYSSAPTLLIWKHFCVLFMGAEAAMLPG
jgi:hypothetical protein